MLRAVAFTLALGACAPAVAPHTVSLRLRGGPRDGSVTVDDVPVGSLEAVRARGVALPPGLHFVTVQAPGYLPYDRQIEAKGAPVVLELDLVAIPE